MTCKVRTPPAAGLAELAGRQHGVVTREQLYGLGVARTTIDGWVRDGRLHRLHRGVYAVGHLAISWEGRGLAAVLARPGAVASHRTAAWIHGLLRSRPGTIHLTAPTRPSRRRDFVVHFAKLAPEDRVIVGEIPLTAPARTALDLAAEETLAGVERLLQRADERGLLDRRRFDELLARTNGHRGHGKLTTALAAFRPETATLRSNLERRFRRLVIAAGLPAPQANAAVEGYEVDCYWEAERFAVELDTFGTHGSRRSFHADRKREDDLLAAGIEVIRVTDVRLEREPRETIARVAAHLERRRRTIASRRSVA
jgi:very-short-patch-repair endonuclease